MANSSSPNATRDGARIPLPGADDWTPEQRRVMEAMLAGPRGEIVGPIRAAIHNHELADRWQMLGEVLRYRTVFPPELSELAILVTARRWNSELEWVIHAGVARKTDLPETVIAALRDGVVPNFADAQQAEVYRFVTELQTRGKVTDDAYDAILQRWGARGTVELTAISGYYSMVAMTLNAHQIPLPEGREPELNEAGGQPDRLHQFPA